MSPFDCNWHDLLCSSVCSSSFWWILFTLSEICYNIFKSYRLMTLPEKQQLQRLSQKLPPRNLDRVVEIIRRDTPFGRYSSDEIYVDLEKEARRKHNICIVNECKLYIFNCPNLVHFYWNYCRITLHFGDCITMLKLLKMPESFPGLLILSKPYNHLKSRNGFLQCACSLHLVFQNGNKFLCYLNSSWWEGPNNITA